MARRLLTWSGFAKERPGMRLAILVLLTMFGVGCSGSGPVAPASATESAETVAKNCADPKWKDKNLGLWYSVCRQSIQW